MKVQTDTATIILYDLACLKHRLADACDWWSVPRLELEEINSGNAIFIGTGCDGVFEVEICPSKPPEKYLKFLVRNNSGKFFLGGGESISGEEFEPDEEDGVFIEYPPGNYIVSAWEHDGILKLNITPTNEVANNEYTASPRIA